MTTLQDLGKPLAYGRTAEIYAWPSQTIVHQPAAQIVKLFLAGESEKAVRYEAELTSRVAATGMRVPAVGNVVQLDGRFGLLYERVTGEPLMNQLEERPWQFSQVAHTLAQVQAQIHIYAAPKLPSQHERLARNIEQAKTVPSHLRTTALQVLKSLPAGNQLCHGDFHPNNVLMTAAGPIVIDWMNATRGNPVADVVQVQIILRHAGLPARWWQRWPQQTLRFLLNRHYTRDYLRLNLLDQSYFVRWYIPVIAARLSEEIPNERASLLATLQRLCRAFG